MVPPEPEQLERAAERVRVGGLVAYPTETVWGLGGDAHSERALEGIRRFKGRRDDAPISILVSGPDELAPLGFLKDDCARAFARRFWPGPLTLVLPCKGRFARGVARRDGAVGVRCSPHPVAAALADRMCRAGIGPLTATSLNVTGEPAATTREQARAVCEAAAEPPLVVAGEADAGGGAPSTVLDLTGERARVLRWGALGVRELGPALQEITLA